MSREEAVKILEERAPWLDIQSPHYHTIQKMTWSFSRVNGWHDCKFSWFHTYLQGDRGVENAWSQMGTFAHELLERLYGNVITVDALKPYWDAHYKKQVLLDFPKLGSTDLKSHYFNKIGRYFTMYPTPKNVIGIESEFLFTLPSGKLFKGFIDLVTRPSGIVVVDHKVSKEFDKADLIKKRRQIHTYFLAIPLLFKEPAIAGYFHFLQTGALLKVENIPEEVQDTLDWLEATIHEIEHAQTFPPVLDELEGDERKKKLFFCSNICSHYDKCPALEKELGYKPKR